MKEAKLLVVEKSYKDDATIDNVLNYMVNSVFADEDEICGSLIDTSSCESMIQAMKQIQTFADMNNHRKLFHLILTTRASKASQRIIDTGVQVLRSYFSQLGHQTVFVTHDGGNGSYKNYHCHIAVNPISLNGNRLYDNSETYNCIIDFLNLYTPNIWSWQFTKPEPNSYYQC